MTTYPLYNLVLDDTQWIYLDGLLKRQLEQTPHDPQLLELMDKLNISSSEAWRDIEPSQESPDSHQ